MSLVVIIDYPGCLLITDVELPLDAGSRRCFKGDCSNVLLTCFIKLETTPYININSSRFKLELVESVCGISCWM